VAKHGNHCGPTKVTTGPLVHDVTLNDGTVRKHVMFKLSREYCACGELLVESKREVK
jgi:hypothetical protein